MGAHWRATVEVDGPPHKARVSRLDAHSKWLVAGRLADSDMTLDVLAERLEAERGVPIHPATLSRFFAAQAITVKKRFASEQDRGDVALARWFWKREQHAFDPERLIFIDEMGADRHDPAL